MPIPEKGVEAIYYWGRGSALGDRAGIKLIPQLYSSKVANIPVLTLQASSTQQHQKGPEGISLGFLHTASYLNSISLPALLSELSVCVDSNGSQPWFHDRITWGALRSS